MSNRAKKLVELLEEHVDVQYHAEQHYMAAVNSAFGSMKLEKQSYDDVGILQTGLAQNCEKAGFKYQLLLELIPPPFSTNHMDRTEILRDLTEYAKENYDYST